MGRGLRTDRGEISSWGGWAWNLGRGQSGFGAGHEEQHGRSPGTGTGEEPRGTGVSTKAAWLWAEVTRGAGARLPRPGRPVKGFTWRACVA